MFRCDVGYLGPTCLPIKTLPANVQAGFENIQKLKNYGWQIYGGNTVDPNAEGFGCSSMTGSSFLHFDKVTLFMFTQLYELYTLLNQCFLNLKKYEQVNIKCFMWNYLVIDFKFV